MISASTIIAGRKWPVYAALGLVFIGYLFLAVHSYRSIDQELTDSALSKRLSIAQLAAATLSEKFDRLIDIGISLATRVQFRRLMAEGKWLEAAEILREVPQDFPFIDRVFLADVHGTETAAVPELEGAVGRNFSHRDWYRGVSRNWEPYISPLYKRAAIPQHNVFAAAVPIKDSDGEVLGILVLQQALEDFFTWAQGIDVGPDGFVYVVDGKGQIAFHPKYPAQGEIVDYMNVPVVQKVLRRMMGVEITFNPVEQEERVSAYVPVKHGWGVIAQQPVRSAFADKNSQLRRIVIGYALILLFCVLVLWLAVSVFRQRRQAEEDRRVKAELERLVAERTAQLAAANRELEGFSYSISHDLRAPLRAIEGFSQILEEDYGARLDDEGRRLLGVVRDSAKKMSALIDDLLAFSRLGRQAIKPVEIRMDDLAREVFEEILSQAGANRSQFIIHPMPGATGDRALLRQVWMNLLSNAVKYSANREQPVIDVGGQLNGSEAVYYVKDNGAGFDMQYYDKLFSVFQRLHPEEEFSGTGIGLAIVQRVVTRHGGRVWAEGKPGVGAVFYFSLPKGDPGGRLP